MIQLCTLSATQFVKCTSSSISVCGVTYLCRSERATRSGGGARWQGQIYLASSSLWRNKDDL